MSRLEDLIKELCPNGVEFKTLGEVLDYEQPQRYIVESPDYESQGTPVLTAGQTFILGYTNETDGIFQASKENPVIIFDDFTTSFHWVDFNFKVKSSAMKMLRPSVESASFKFIYYAMKCIKYETLEHSRQWISKYSLIKIPFPPLEVQQEIARILDKFATLEAELEAELEARRKQYLFYRERLLNFKNNTPLSRILGEVCKILKGTQFNKSDMNTEGSYPVFNGGVGASGYIEQYNQDENTITISQGGASAGYVNWQATKFWAGAHCYVVKPLDSVNVRYLFHFIKANEKILMQCQYGAGIPALAKSKIESLEIPLPSLQEQEKIANILDKFSTLIEDISSGLPAEIKMRHQQYEYYRDKLLTFTQAA